METAGGSDSEERRMSKARTEHGAARSPGSTSKKMQPAKKSKKSATAKRKKPKDMPRRPLSAYNIFFREERRRILEEREAGQLGQVTSLFSTMGKEIARRWKKLSPEQIVKYADLANQDMERYRREMELYNLGVRTFDKKAKPAPTLPGATSPPPAGVQSAVRGINDLLTAGAVLDAAPGRGSQAAMSPGPRFDVASRLSEQVAPAATALDITRYAQTIDRTSTKKCATVTDSQPRFTFGQVKRIGSPPFGELSAASSSAPRESSTTDSSLDVDGSKKSSFCLCTEYQ
jgi:hypothetical protein